MTIAAIVRLLTDEGRTPTPLTETGQPDMVLTPQELRVALATARGLDTRELAAALCMSSKTVEHHLSHIYRKLHVRSRSQLSALVIDYLLAACLQGGFLS